MLYKLAQEGFKPAKYFSIDRVFRNEAVDRTHLAEFHQVEGEWGTGSSAASATDHLLKINVICLSSPVTSGF
jgi:phenylalanyl-tRNA synthetase alpha subunit